MLNFIEIKNDTLLKILNNLAINIWNEYYTPLIGNYQVNYILETIYTKTNIKKDIENGYKYYILQKYDQNIGYMAFGIRNDKLRDITQKSIHLSKLYLSKQFRNKGLGKITLDFVINHKISKDAKKLWLMVNKKNATTIKTYENFGFNCYRCEKKDIGKGYIIEECLMIKDL